MALEGKHSFGSIGEIRVTFVEKNVDQNRKNFLKALLEHNGFEVLIEDEKKKIWTTITDFTEPIPT